MLFFSRRMLLVLLQISLLACNLSSAQERMANLKKKVKKLQGKMVHLRQLVMKELPSTSCDDHYRHGVTTDGIYIIYLNGTSTSVYCAFNYASTGTNWMVMQRRFNGKLSFQQTYSNYTKGFGNPAREFWMGLQKVHEITKITPHELRIDLEDAKGNKVYATYSDFAVGDARSGYVLSVNGYNGTAGDCFSQHSGAKFSAKDKDQDSWFRSCAKERLGGWWYRKCTFGNLNGKYASGTNDYRGMYWFYWKFSVESLARTEMKIRPKLRA